MEECEFVMLFAVLTEEQRHNVMAMIKRKIDHENNENKTSRGGAA